MRPSARSMSPNFRIALRFLTAKKRSMLMSLSCITLGVGLFVVTQATTSGFEGLFIKTVLGTDGAMRIEDKIQDTIFAMAAGGHDIGGSKFEVAADRAARKYIEGVEDPELLTKALREFRNVAGVSTVVEGSVIAGGSLAGKVSSSASSSFASIPSLSDRLLAFLVMMRPPP